MIPILPEMLDSVTPLYPKQEERVNDLSSGIFNSFLGIGLISGPIYGSLMASATSFQYTCDSVSFICLGFALSYFVLGDGYSAFKNSIRNLRNRDNLKDNVFIELSKWNREEFRSTMSSSDLDLETNTGSGKLLDGYDECLKKN